MSKKDADVFKIPHDLVNEQIVMAAALTDERARGLLLSRLRSDMFVDDQHGVLWDAVQEADRKKLQPTAGTLVQLSGGRVEASYVRDLTTLHPTAPVNIRHHLESLLWDVARIRSVNGPLAELMRGLQDPSTSPERVKALANQVSVSFENTGARKYLRDTSQLTKSAAHLLANRMDGIACYPTGIDALDKYGPHDFDDNGQSLAGKPLLIPGIAPGKVSLVTAISGGGKSTLTALMVLNIARQQRKVLYGAWEMGSEETLLLLACISTGIPRSRVTTGDITTREFKKLQETMEFIGEYVRFMDMPFHKERGIRRSHDEVLDEIHAYIADSGCEVAVFDLWRRAFRRMRDESEEAEALYRQQAIAEETNCHVCIVQQQRLKDVEKRSNARPTREGIKGSSAFVDVCDLILGVYIPSLMKGTACNTIETIVLKQRYGKWPIVVEHSWDGDLVKLSHGQMVAYDPGSEQDLDGSGKKWLKGTRD